MGEPIVWATADKETRVRMRNALRGMLSDFHAYIETRDDGTMVMRMGVDEPLVREELAKLAKTAGLKMDLESCILSDE